MHRNANVLAVTTAIIAALSSPARAGPADVCKAFGDLVASAHGTDLPLVVNFSNSEYVGEDRFSSCWPVATETTRVFCSVIVESGGVHGLHRFPVWIANCIAEAGSRPRIQRIPPTPWGPTIRRVKADLPLDVRVEITFKPDSSRLQAPQLGEAYGTYELVIGRR